MSLEAVKVWTQNKKTRDEIKLHLYNAGVDHERKYRIVELEQKEKDFKRKYSWCIRPNNPERRKPFPAKIIKQETQQTKTAAKRHGSLSNKSELVSRKGTDSVKSENGCVQMKDDWTSGSSCKDLTESPDDTLNVRSRHPSSASSRRTSVAGNELPSLVDAKKKSLLNVEGDDRVTYLEELWNKVFGMEADNSTHSGRNSSNTSRNSRRQKRSLKETYTGIVMQQFESNSGSGNVTTQLPDINRRTSVHVPNYSREKAKAVPNADVTSSLHEKDDGMWADMGLTENNGHDGESDKGRSPKPDTSNMNEKQAESQFNESVQTDVTNTGDPTQIPESETDSKETKDSEEDNIKSTTKSARPRRKSANVPLPKPSFQVHCRPRSQSVDFNILKYLWKAANLNLLASRRTGKDRLTKCVGLAVTRDKLADLQGERWREDLKKCRYLRIPKNSPYLSPIHSDSDSDL